MKYIIFNSFVNISSEEEYFLQIDNALKNKDKITFFYQNAFSLYLASKNLQFKKVLNKSDFIIPDGFSIVFGIKKLYKQRIDKVVFTYFFLEKLHEYLSNKNTKLFLLGSDEKTIEVSKNILIEKYNLNITGFHHGYFNLPAEQDSTNIIQKINQSNAEVLIVGMGMPKSEIWIQENLNSLNVNCIFSVGGFFDFISGKSKIAPKLLYNSGFEWVYRLLQEPKRLFKRYFFSNIYFIFRLIKEILTFSK